MAREGHLLSPLVQEPSGMIGIIAFPNGKIHFKADLLPEGREIEYAIEMMKTAIAKLEEKRSKETMDLMMQSGGFIKGLDSSLST